MTDKSPLDNEIKFTYKDRDYTVDPMNEWSHDGQLAMEQTKLATLLSEVLSSEDYAAFKATKPKLKDTAEFANAMFEALGTSLGESKGS